MSKDSGTMQIFLLLSCTIASLPMIMSDEVVIDLDAPTFRFLTKPVGTAGGRSLAANNAIWMGCKPGTGDGRRGCRVIVHCKELNDWPCSSCYDQRVRAIELLDNFEYSTRCIVVFEEAGCTGRLLRIDWRNNCHLDLDECGMNEGVKSYTACYQYNHKADKDKAVPSNWYDVALWYTSHGEKMTGATNTDYNVAYGFKQCRNIGSWDVGSISPNGLCVKMYAEVDCPIDGQHRYSLSEMRTEHAGWKYHCSGDLYDCFPTGKPLSFGPCAQPPE